MTDGEAEGEADGRQVLRSLQDPARYRAFLDGDRPAGAPGDRSRDLAGVAARLAAALQRKTGGPAEREAGLGAGKGSGGGAGAGADEPDPETAHHRVRHPVLRAPASAQSEATRAGYSAHSADLVLDGGLEAAVAAAPAVCALAERFALRRVTGSSTSALTAALAAAAELGRTAPQGEASGFAGLAGAVAWLAAPERPAEGPAEGAAPERLLRMLRPDRVAAPLYRVLVAVVRPRRAGVAGPVTRLTEASLTAMDGAARAVVGLLWVGAMAIAAGVITALARSPHVAGWVVAVAAVPLVTTFALAAAFGTAVVAAQAVRAAIRPALEDEGFGLVAGSRDDVDGAGDSVADPDTGEADADDPALVDWIADRLDDLAGVPAAAGGTARYALTFGELWLGRMGGRAGADVRELRRAAVDSDRRVVDLQLVTTDLSSSRSRSLPFAATDERFAFCRTCLVGLLPVRVVDQMVLMSWDVVADRTCPRHAGQPLHELPDPEDLPVAFAVRMAAATPLLLRPVPLYRRVAEAEAEAGDGAAVRVHWFGDGAVTGGLPDDVTRRSAARWPTFSLGAVPARGDGTGERWRPVPAGPAGSVAALLTSALGWRSVLRGAAQGEGAGAAEPGHDRTATVPGTGQLLPFVDADGLAGLAARGYRAGVALRDETVASVQRPRETDASDGIPTRTS